jgi:hypothetical protein
VCKALSAIMEKPSPKGNSKWADIYDSDLTRYTGQSAPEEPKPCPSA